MEPSPPPDTSADCQHMRRSTSLHLDDELPQPERQQLAHHLDHCDTCREFATTLAALTRTLRNPTPPRPTT
jgi:predicted anti-sigma-YlaC factor YlaD